MKIKFVHSIPYDRAICELVNKRYDLKKIPDRVNKYLKEIEKLWRPIESKILKELSKITGIHFENDIICYVNYYGRMAYSHPLTMNIFVLSLGEKRPYQSFINTLIHELIHQYTARLHRENKIKKMLKYEDEPITTRNHILLYAIMKYIFLKLFDEKRFTKRMFFETKRPVYKRAWEIVEKEGYKNILNWIIK